jgi:hypothetical protein
MGREWGTWTAYVFDQRGSEGIALKLPDIRDCHVHLRRPILTRVDLVLHEFMERSWKGAKRDKCEEDGPVV